MRTGKEIYEEIKKAENDRKELSKALDILFDNAGPESAAYKIVKRAYDFQTKEIDTLKNKEYVDNPIETKHLSPLVQEHNSKGVF